MRWEVLLIALTTLPLMGVAVKKGGGGGAGLVHGTESQSGIDYDAHPTQGSQICWKEAQSSTHVGSDPDTTCWQIVSEIDHGAATKNLTIGSDGLLMCERYSAIIADTGIGANGDYTGLISPQVTSGTLATNPAANVMLTCPPTAGVDGCTVERVGLRATNTLSNTEQCMVSLQLDSDQDPTTVESVVTGSEMYVGADGHTTGNDSGDLRCLSAGCTADGTPQEYGDALDINLSFQVDSDEAITVQAIDAGASGCASPANCDCSGGIDSVQVEVVLCWVPDEA